MFSLMSTRSIKYEIVGGMINEDVVEFHPSKQYDLIISIFISSVGWEETSRDPMKTLYAINNLKRLLGPRRANDSCS